MGLAYDERGNLSNQNGQGFDFDFGNRLREAVGKEHYQYDALGRRVTASSAQGTIYSFYSQAGQLMAQRNERLTPMKDTEYVYFNGSLVASRETPQGGVTTIRYQHTDALGTPVAVTDGNGELIETSEYTPFGQLYNRPLTDGPGYTGHVSDALTGLSYMQQRYYDPGIGRFLSVDPVTANPSTGANFNRYWYANNNPYLFTDPDGRWGTPPFAFNPQAVQAAAVSAQAQRDAALYLAPKAIIMETGAIGAAGTFFGGAGTKSVGVIIPVTEPQKYTTYESGGRMSFIGNVSASTANQQPSSGQFALGAAVDCGPSIGIGNSTGVASRETATSISLITPKASATFSYSGADWSLTAGGGGKGIALIAQDVETKKIFSQQDNVEENRESIK